MSKTRRSLALTLALALAPACTTTLAIRSMQPGTVPIGAAKHLVYVGGEGRRSAREFVGQELVQQCRSQGWFSFEDQSERGLSVRIAGRNATVEGGSLALESDHAGLRVDVLEWNATSETEEQICTDVNGKQYVERHQVTKGQALLAVTLFDPSGRALLAEAEYDGCATLPSDAPREQAIESAARNAIAGFLRDVTPVQVTTRVRLDDEDDGQAAFLETAANGGTAQAAQDLEAYFQRNPSSASAAYNLGVLKEALGDFRTALEWYDRALSLGGEDYYSKARAGCARRLDAAEALSAQNAGH